jgi:hypothetical protein
MKLLLDQLPFYQAICYAAIIHGVLWTILPLAVAKIMGVRIKGVNLMSGKGKIHKILGYDITVGWIPTGASLTLEENAFREITAWKWAILSMTATAGLFLISYLIAPPQDYLHEASLSYTRMLDSLISPWDVGGPYLYQFGEIASNSIPRAVSLLCFYSALLQLIPWPPFTSMGNVFAKLIPNKYYSTLCALGALASGVLLIALAIAYIRTCLLFIG